MFGMDKRGFDSRAELQRISATKILPARNGAERGYFMLYLKKLFNYRELSMLSYALTRAISDEKRIVELYGGCTADSEWAKEASDNLLVLKSLYRRFFPNLSDDVLFGDEVTEGGEVK